MKKDHWYKVDVKDTLVEKVPEETIQTTLEVKMELTRVVEEMQKEGSQPIKPPEPHSIIKKKKKKVAYKEAKQIDITKKWDPSNTLIIFWVGVVQIFPYGNGKVLKHYLRGKVNGANSSIYFDNT